MVTPKQSGRVGVQVVCVAGGRDFVKEMLVPVGQSVGWCVNASGFQELGDKDSARLKIGVWGKIVDPQTVVLEGDRIEVYVPCLPEAVAKARKMKVDLRAGGIVEAPDLGDNRA